MRRCYNIIRVFVIIIVYCNNIIAVGCLELHRGHGSRVPAGVPRNRVIPIIISICYYYNNSQLMLYTLIETFIMRI